MSDPTTPDPKPAAETAAEITTEIPAVVAPEEPAPGKAGSAKTEPSKTEPGAADNAGAEKAAAEKAGAAQTAVETAPAGKKFWKRGRGAATKAKDAEAPKKPWWRRIRIRGPWLTVTGALAILIVLALLGYIWGLGPLNRLNAERSIVPPAKLAGLDRVTDPEIRSQAQLDQTRDALSRINDGKKVTVEAYGSLQGDRFFVLIAMRGKVDLDKTVGDSGATGDQITKVGKSTCVETGNLPTQCYLTSSTLTVILQSANDDVKVDQVVPVAEEAFNAMK